MKVISFNIITLLIIYTIAGVLLFKINLALGCIFSIISVIHILYFYILGNKLKKFNNEKLFKKTV